MGSKLDELFDSYEKRKQAEEREAREKAERARRERAESQAFIRKRVLPPLRSITEEVRARGHHARLTELLDEQNPTLIMEFTPARRSELPPFPEQSRLTLVCNAGGWIETTQDIAMAASRGVAERWKLVDVNEQWATRQALSLIEAALRQH